MRSSCFVLLCSLAALPACSLNVEQSEKSITGTATVTAQWGLRLRSGPSTSTSILAVMPSGSFVQVLGGPDNGFYHLRFAPATGPVEGWAHGSYLDIVEDAAPDAGMPVGPDSGVSNNMQTATVTAPIALNLRQGPSSSYPIIDVLLNGEVVDLLGGQQNNYYEVLAHRASGDIAGWAWEHYLELPSVAPPPPPPPPTSDEFSYPTGNFETEPAGGWSVWQVLGHFHSSYGGRHQAQDIASAQGGLATINAPIYNVADGVVRYAGPNGSTYRNVVLVEHPLEDGTSICSFFGHINTPLVSTGDQILRGDQLATVMDWNAAAGGASSNTHLHYVFLSKALCDASAAAGGRLICGYDKGGPNSIYTLADEPAAYTSVADGCGDSNYANAFISPSQFIEAHKAP